MKAKLFKISTTAYEEEDFYVVTDLHETDLTEVINPLVMAERDGEGGMRVIKTTKEHGRYIKM